MVIAEMLLIGALLLWAYLAFRKVIQKRKGCNNCSACSRCSYYDSCPQNQPQSMIEQPNSDLENH